ncbi:MAG: sulfotransferase [Acidimicrobiales bacterium]
MTAPPVHSRSSVCALVPHFRCELWLGQALESLLDQTRPPDAIVVIDDGSGEPPVDVVREYPEVTLLEAADNSGPYRAVQAVIDRTDFDSYLFQDADDWSAPERLEVLLDEGARTGAGLIGSHEVRVLVAEGDIVPVRYPRDVNAVLAERPTAFPLLHPTSLVAGALVRRLGGFATGMRFSGDAEFLRRAVHLARVVNADHFAYFRRKRPGSLTLGSDTALGSPARQQVQDVLAARAQSNAERVAAGRAPDLRPWRVVPGAVLRHRCGPLLSRAGGGPPRTSATVRRQNGVAEPGAAGGPVFLVGAPRSGHTVLALAIGQHPRLELLHDSRWLARAAADVELRLCDDAAPAPPDCRAALADALRTAAQGDGGRRPVATAPDLLPVAHAVASLFPDSRFVHVVRDATATAAALAGAPTADGSFFTADAAWRAWVAATAAGLALEAALGADRVVRVRYDELVEDPAGTVQRCLAFLGEAAAAACVRPLTDLTALVDVDAPPAPAALTERVAELTDTLAVTAPPAEPAAAARRHLAECFRRDWSSGRPGASLVERMRALVTSAVPEGATVAVVSRGDPRLVDLGGRVGWHVPQTDGGVYAGHHPADSQEAVAQVEALRSRGAAFLAVPASGLWWLTFYEGLRSHLEVSAALVAFHEEVGAVFRLSPTPRAADDAKPAPVQFVPVPARVWSAA